MAQGPLIKTVNGREFIGVARTGVLEDLPVEEMDDRYSKKVQVIGVSSPSEDWFLSHELGGYPSVEITDSSGGRCYGSVVYLSSTLIHVHFSSPFSGEARLRQ